MSTVFQRHPVFLPYAFLGAVFCVLTAGFAAGQEAADSGSNDSELIEQDSGELDLSELPTVEEVIGMYHGTVGGEEFVRNLTSTRSRAKIDVTGVAERRGLLTNAWSAPGKIHMSTAYRDSGMHVAASDGKLHWIISDITGNRIVNGSESELTRTMNNPLRYLNRDEFYEGVAVVGVEVFNDSQCYKLEFFLPDGEAQYHFFEVESGRLMGLEYNVDTPVEYSVTATYSDFREVEGAVLPFHIVQEYSMGMTAEVEYLSRELNVEVEEALFEIPDEINDLLLNGPDRALIVPMIQVRPAIPVENFQPVDEAPPVEEFVAPSEAADNDEAGGG
ncbi:MAG: hypothetical protein AAF456_15165 [Planctomycetota bacterium]